MKSNKLTLDLRKRIEFGQGTSVDKLLLPSTVFFFYTEYYILYKFKFNETNLQRLGFNNK